MNTIRRRPPQNPTSAKYAVLVDGSALFLASRTLEERKLNYFALMDILTNHPDLPGLAASGEASDCIWTMWTAADPRNSGQTKFLDFVEQQLRWEVRGILPYQAYMVEPEVLFGLGELPPKAKRLIRFDAQIAFAMGALGQDYRLVVISDSFALYDSMVRVNENWHAGRSTLAFFGHACDPRWRSALVGPSAPGFIDLDEYQTEIFGIQEQEVLRSTKASSKRVY